MHGVGEATAAITFVNALPTGVGAAGGIELRAHVEVALAERRTSDGEGPVIRPTESATPLVRAALTAAVRRYAPEDCVASELLVRSEIPRAVGLKSSSAVASAIVLAVARAGRSRPGPEAVAEASAQIAREAGLSATGAFDDALAGLVGGAVVTDNRADRLVRAHPIAPELAVVVWVPTSTHPPSPELRSRFGPESPNARAAVDAAAAGRLWEAMELNSELVEGVLDYPYAELRHRLREAGAVAAGTSGMGPAVAAVGPRDGIPALLREFAGRPGRCFAVEFSRSPPPGELR